MPPKPNTDTANKIKSKISQLTWFLYLATENSATSRWCPWEIGYADGVKNTDMIVIIPTRDRDGRNYGNEYLDLYRHISRSTEGELGVFRPSGKGIHLNRI